MTDRELMQQALDALDIFYDEYGWGEKQQKAHEALRARLAQPEQVDEKGKPMTYWGGLAQREWQGLTDEERTYLAWESNNGPHCVAMTEAKLKEKNT